MKKVLCVTLGTLALLLGGAHLGYARGVPRGRPGVHGHPGFHGRHEFTGHRGFHGHPHGRTRVFLGSGIWWGPGWWGPPFPYYTDPPVIVQQEPPIYSDPEAQSQDYWYYCQNPPGYYPYVQQCPGGWMTVVPQAAPPAQ